MLAASGSARSSQRMLLRTLARPRTPFSALQVLPRSQSRFQRSYGGGPGRFEALEQAKRGFYGHPLADLHPAIWAVAISGGIFACFSLYSVYQDVVDYKKRHRTTRTPTSLSEVDHDVRRRQLYAYSPSTRSSDDIFINPLALWNDLTPVGRVALAICVINLGVLGACRVNPSLVQRFGYTPISGKNSTMLTSNFVHGGAIHLALNTYGLCVFGMHVAQDRKMFDGSASHFLSFYLASGILSSLGTYVITMSRFMPAVVRNGRFAPGIGASGAIMAFLGADLTANPNERIMVFPLPGSFSAENIFLGLIAFETLGLFGLIPLLGGIGHAAHLTGLAVGYVYTVYDGKNHLWEICRERGFQVLRLTRAI